MNKREMLHTLLDRVLDVEETSKKGVRFSLSGNFCSIYFKSRDAGGSEDIGKYTAFFFNDDTTPTSFAEAISEIEKVKITPDIDPKLQFLLTEEKAKELGLIA